MQADLHLFGIEQVSLDKDHLSRVMRKPAFSYGKTKTQISFAVTAKLISAFVFSTRIVQSLHFLYTKFPAPSHLVWLYSLVCVRPGRKSRRPVFSQRGSFNHIMLKCPCNIDPLTPHFYIVKLEFTGVYEGHSRNTRKSSITLLLLLEFNQNSWT